MSTVTMSKPTANHSQEFEDLFREHHLLVYRTACAITGNCEDAEDVLQTIFLRLMRRSVPPDIRKNPKGYFYRAAVHLSLDTIRARRREVLTADFAAIEGHIRVEAPTGNTPPTRD
jgi:RNA polymerase sigma factor (sigma-70 family)